MRAIKPCYELFFKNRMLKLAFSQSPTSLLFLTDYKTTFFSHNPFIYKMTQPNLNFILKIYLLACNINNPFASIFKITRFFFLSLIFHVS